MEKSLWAEGTLLPEFPSLKDKIKTDVLIIGDHRRRNVRGSVRAFSGTVRSIHGTAPVTVPDLRRTEP